MDVKLHPASTVTNIKSLISVTLEMDSGLYASWSELFRLHCRVFQVIQHLSPKPVAESYSSKETEKDKDKSAKPVDDSWDRLDAIVLQWIYATISSDLLHTILKPNATAHEAWVALENIFQDNKSSRAIHLLHKFSNTRLSGFPNVSAYCQQLKVLSDQLASVGSPVDNQSLVLQLISGLNEQYEGIATILQNQDRLPSFYDARSKLIMVETRKAEQALQASQTAGTALNTHASRSTGNNTAPADYRSDGQYGGRGRGRGSRGRGRGRNSWGRGWSNHSSTHWQQQWAVTPPWAAQQWAPPFPWASQQWAAPTQPSWAANQQQQCPLPIPDHEPHCRQLGFCSWHPRSVAQSS
ncbi:uncharacterized protein LOC110888135 [Helianthus annuus]|uniref:uncharacterized protein LOC110888135 n=1 Tax=Helianthus annuus TaxID=4232 RepID=UPI000B900472|nr:uncharacterized protein LOC110888135 [Helianthus annuus]